MNMTFYKQTNIGVISHYYLIRPVWPRHFPYERHPSRLIFDHPPLPWYQIWFDVVYFWQNCNDWFRKSVPQLLAVTIRVRFICSSQPYNATYCQMLILWYILKYWCFYIVIYFDLTWHILMCLLPSSRWTSPRRKSGVLRPDLKLRFEILTFL